MVLIAISAAILRLPLQSRSRLHKELLNEPVSLTKEQRNVLIAMSFERFVVWELRAPSDPYNERILRSLKYNSKSFKPAEALGLSGSPHSVSSDYLTKFHHWCKNFELSPFAVKIDPGGNALQITFEDSGKVTFDLRTRRLNDGRRSLSLDDQYLDRLDTAWLFTKDRSSNGVEAMKRLIIEDLQFIDERLATYDPPHHNMSVQFFSSCYDASLSGESIKLPWSKVYYGFGSVRGQRGLVAISSLTHRNIALKPVGKEPTMLIRPRE